MTYPAHKPKPLVTPADKPYRQRLYGGYISTGQAHTGSDAQPFSAGSLAHVRSVIRRHVPAGRDSRIVDLACGHGILVKCLRDMGYRNVRGFDISGEQVEMARRLGIPNVEQQELRAALQGERESIDVIFLFDVLEHLTKDELLETLDIVNLALAPGGVVIVHVPNAAGLHGMHLRYGDLTHEQCFTASSLRQAFRACGFSRVECFEDKPVPRGLKSSIRRVLWELLTLAPRLRLLAETGERGLLSQALVATARK
jgi:SAM-dependent methyltransferase